MNLPPVIRSCSPLRLIAFPWILAKYLCMCIAGTTWCFAVMALVLGIGFLILEIPMLVITHLMGG